MIYCELSGRCGNQLFACAAARNLQIFLYPEESLCFNTFKVDRKGCANSLVEFRTPSLQYISSRRKHVSMYGTLVQRACRQLYSSFLKRSFSRLAQFQPVLNYFGLYALTHVHAPFNISKARYKFMEGLFDSPKIFDQIRPQLLDELQPISPPPEKNKKLYEIISKNESVCVTIRRGDYFGQYEYIFGVCKYDYFTRAIERMKQLKPNVVFIVFSDEIDWVKKNFSFDCKCYYEDGSDSISEKLRLMYSCKHYILSNSTFSWWAQYLCRNENKVVISPHKWTKENKFVTPLIQKNWILLDT